MNLPCLTKSVFVSFRSLYYSRVISHQVASVVLFMYMTLSSSDVAPDVLDRPDDERLELEPIGSGTYDFFSNLTRDISDKPWADARKESHHHTRSLRLAKCEKLQNTTCFGAKMSWKFTSIQLSNEESQEKSMHMLYQLEASRFVPLCWAVIQVSPFRFNKIL